MTSEEYRKRYGALSATAYRKFHKGYERLVDAQDLVGRWDWPGIRAAFDAVLADYKKYREVYALLAHVAREWCEASPFYGMTHEQGKARIAENRRADEAAFRYEVRRDAKAGRLMKWASVTPDGTTYLPSVVKQALEG